MLSQAPSTAGTFRPASTAAAPLTRTAYWARHLGSRYEVGERLGVPAFDWRMCQGLALGRTGDEVGGLALAEP